MRPGGMHAGLSDASPAEEFAAFLDEQLPRHELSAEQLRAWRPAKEFLKGTKG